MSEKTEQPTAKKLRDARKKGDVPRSKDISKAVLMWGLLSYVIFFGAHIVDQLAFMIQWTGDNAYKDFAGILPNFVDMGTQSLVTVLAPFLVLVIFVAIVIEFVHVGVVFAPDKLKPSFSKMSVVSNVKNIFSKKNLLEALKSTLKVAVLSFTLWLILRDNISTLILIPPAGMQGMASAFGTLLKSMLLSAALVFGLIGLADLFLQRQLFFSQQKMSKDEIKREYKEMDGDPHIKHHRKQLHRELSSAGRSSAVRSASAVVVNPVHFAVAIRYVSGETPLPLIVAKGGGAEARQIVGEARSAGVPVIQDIPLARALIADGDVDDYVPDHLLEATVQILQAVRDLGAQWE